jgi:4-amino-4-deoxy-L-arabinose transferase-like glycosyltransferase
VPDSVSTVLRLMLAGALFVRLAGVGRGWLPSAPVLAAVLIGWLAIRSLRNVDLRGWRARAGLDHVALALIAIALAAVLVRLPSIAVDLGRQPLDIDEHRLSASLKHFFVTGTIDHLTVEHYPGVVFWAMAAASMLAYLGGLMSGAFVGIHDMPVESFTLAGRLTNVGCAALTVGISGLLARRLGGRWAGLLAAALVAFTPLAIDVTTDMRNDPGQVLLVLGAAWTALVAYDRSSAGWATIAGVLAGLATGVKYTSVFALIPALFAAAAIPPAPQSVRGVRPAPDRLRRAGAVLAGFAAALAISNHFLWWDFGNFVRQLSDQVAITGPGHWAASENPAAAHREVLTGVGPGWPLLVIGAAWGAWGLASGQPRAWLFWAFPLLYSWFTTHRPSQFARWVYPLLPFTSIAAACGLVALALMVSRSAAWRRVERGVLARAIAIALIAAVLLPPFRAGAIEISKRTTPSTAQVLEAWLRQTVPAGQTVLLEQGWLDLRGVEFSVMRVPDLRTVLGPAEYELSAADWIVVPETHYADPSLRRLALMHQVVADQRSFRGNLGYDYRVYVTPRLPPVASIDVSLEAAAAQPMLGWEWDRNPRGGPGLLLPDRGASMFVPPLATDEAAIRLDLAHAGTAGGDIPLTLAVRGQPIELSDTPVDAPGIRRLAGRIRVTQSPRAIELRIDPKEHGARLRVLRLQIG